VLLLFVATVIGRLALATGYLRCDADRLVWRSVLVTHHVPWERVAAIETTLAGRPIPRRRRGTGA
jgi:hypothetical protein